MNNSHLLDPLFMLFETVVHPLLPIVVAMVTVRYGQRVPAYSFPEFFSFSGLPAIPCNCKGNDSRCSYSTGQNSCLSFSQHYPSPSFYLICLLQRRPRTCLLSSPPRSEPAPFFCQSTPLPFLLGSATASTTFLCTRAKKVQTFHHGDGGIQIP